MPDVPVLHDSTEATPSTAGTSAAGEAWLNRPRRAIEDAPFWYTDAQKQ